MKFRYEYRTPDNARHADVVEASDREAAFRQLKARGIRPGRLVEAPGFFNKLFGRGKRWLTIGVLVLACLALALAALHYFRAAQNAGREAAWIYRSQLFGDPSVLQALSRDGWRVTFPDAGEAFLARHAIPGRVCDCPAEGTWRGEIAAALLAKREAYLELRDSDGEELKKMKRIVNGMKREFSEYVAEPADALEYLSRCCERCRVEKGVRENLVREIESMRERLAAETADRGKLLADWEKHNATLRSLGLAAIPLPEQ